MDIKPREIFITVCLLLPIIGIGFYPKLATQTYDVKTVQVATEVRNAISVYAEQRNRDRLFSGGFFAPELMGLESKGLLSATDIGKGA